MDYSFQLEARNSQSRWKSKTQYSLFTRNRLMKVYDSKIYIMQTIKLRELERILI